MIRSHVHEGDWVRINQPIAGIPAGALGRVQLVFMSVDETYDVVFSGRQEPTVVFGPQFELVEHAADAAGALLN